MKSSFLIIFPLLFLTSVALAQVKVSANQTKTMIDLYFKPYLQEPGYQINTMGEAMIKSTIDMGNYSNPSVARIMKQIKTFKYLIFESLPDHSKEIFSKVEANIARDKQYKEYFRSEQNDSAITFIYTRESGNKIIELATVSISKRSFTVNCFNGENINLESIRLLTLNK